MTWGSRSFAILLDEEIILDLLTVKSELAFFFLNLLHLYPKLWLSNFKLMSDYQFDRVGNLPQIYLFLKTKQIRRQEEPAKTDVLFNSTNLQKRVISRFYCHCTITS
jgi:hypothetical protein